MKCTACHQGILEPTYLEESLLCHTCSHCGGNWIYIRDYLQWLEGTDNANEASEQQVVVETRDTDNALLCPRTGKIMLKYRISRDTEHRLDFSPSCNGIWMDQGEWQILKKAGLSRELNVIFTSQWQNRIRAASTREMMEKMYINEFGEADYRELCRVREWLAGKELKSSMLAFLLDEDPYAVK